MAPGVFTLYRFYDADDALLYVGLSINPGKRFERHRTDKEWWTEVARIEMEQFSDIGSLRAGERDAIKSEHPRHNIRMTEPVVRVSNREKRRTLEGFGWKCISNRGTGTFVKPDRTSVFYTRAAAWEQLQR